MRDSSVFLWINGTTCDPEPALLMTRDKAIYLFQSCSKFRAFGPCSAPLPKHGLLSRRKHRNGTALCFSPIKSETVDKTARWREKGGATPFDTVVMMKEKEKTGRRAML